MSFHLLFQILELMQKELKSVKLSIQALLFFVQNQPPEFSQIGNPSNELSTSHFLLRQQPFQNIPKVP